MSDHDTLTPEIDDELRARLQAFAQEIKERTDPDTALERMPRRSRPPTVRLLAIAACFILAVAIATVVVADRQSVDTVPSSGAPTTLARGVVRFTEPPPATGCCVPPGGGLPVPAGQGLGGQTMDITAVEEHGKVTGEARFTLRDTLDSDLEGFDVVVELDCADTDTGDVILGGTVTTAAGERHSGAFPPVGARMAVIIREGEPDSATVWWTTTASSCGELLESVPEPRPDDRFVEVVEGDDIVTGPADCPKSTQPRVITSGGIMKNRFAAPVASAATALLLLGACSDDDATSSDDGTTSSVDGPTTLAMGEDLGFAGGAPGLSDQTMDITAEEENGEVSGQARLTPSNLTLDLQCADTSTDGLVLIAGQAAERAESVAQPGEWVVVVIREGDPDRVVLWFQGEDDIGSCQEALDAVPASDTDADSATLAEITDGDIETG